MSESQSGHISPDEITSASFETKRRGGLDPDAVRRHLASVASSVTDLIAERDRLQDEVEAIRTELEKQSPGDAEPAPLDEEELTERLGKDAARVLAEARSAAADRIAEAETEAANILAAAEEVHAERSIAADAEAQRIRSGAESVMNERQAEAERAAAAIIAEAEEQATQTRTAGSSEREHADADADRIIREAEMTRRQILEDLARRRSAARRQIEQLRAGRERLLSSHETVRRALDEISEELTISMSEARAAAETAGHNVSDTTIEELEAEIETARLTGLLDTGPVPVVRREPAAKSTTTSAPTPAPVAAEAEPETSVDTTTKDAGQGAQGGEPPSATETIANSASKNAKSIVEAVAEEAAGDPSSPADLAPVVQLDRARSEVDTATHPAKGREAGNGRSPKAPTSPPLTSAALPSSKKVTKLESVKNVPDELTDDDSVGDLFASLRSDTPATPAKRASSTKSTTKKSPGKKSSGKAALSGGDAKKSTATKSTSTGPKGTGSTKKSAPKKAPVAEIAVDSSEMARRLKRVLADEQSRAMSKVKSAAELPSLDELVGSLSDHRETYWTEVLGQMDNPTDASSDARKPVDALVDTIRHRVSEALEAADSDAEAAVTALRNVYREVKTQQIAVCAETVCRAAGVGVGS